MKVTGRIAFRQTWTGRVVLQVEEEGAGWWPLGEPRLRRRWRDATVMDLAQPQLRPLMDLRNGPPLIPRGLVAEPLPVLPPMRINA